MNRIIIVFLLFTVPVSLFSQDKQTEENIKRKDFVFSKHRTVDHSESRSSWNFNIHTKENLLIGNKEYGEGLDKVKARVAQRFPRKEGKDISGKSISFTADTPVVLRNFQGNAFNFGVPNDNTVAISDGGKLISAINSNIYMYDVDSDTLLKNLSLSAFADTLDTISSHQYDPRVLYDPSADRFVFVHLAGASSDTLTNIIVGFSDTNDPTGEWHMYKLPGDPLPGDTNWTDFPAIAVTDDELFITANLLHYGGSWQTSFEQSIVWQIKKQNGYSGADIGASLWHNIHYQGKPLRNVIPIRGGNQTFGPNIYMMSNRNFALQNDTFFLMEITGTLQDSSTDLTIKALQSDFVYGAPPHAEQPLNNKLQTNDARVLGAFYQDDRIQFVGNTVDTINGHATIYHGTIKDVSVNPQIQGHIFRDTLDYAYPNIAYTGKSAASEHSIISFNHTSSSVFPGSSAMYYEGNASYSEPITLKQGDKVINILSGADRWGDFTGSQPRYNHPGRVWVTTSYGFRKDVGMISRYVQGTWVSELSSQLDDSTTKVHPVQNIASVKTYPNPVLKDDWVFVEFQLNEKKWVSMEVVDINGRKVRSFLKKYMKPGTHEVNFSTNRMEKGVYIFVIQADNEEVVSRKIIIQ
ncbi:MAG: T9SS type A sorting domain-containing protein [Bacteroidales bacterium]